MHGDWENKCKGSGLVLVRGLYFSILQENGFIDV